MLMSYDIGLIVSEALLWDGIKSSKKSWFFNSGMRHLVKNILKLNNRNTAVIRLPNPNKTPFIHHKSQSSRGISFVKSPINSTILIVKYIRYRSHVRAQLLSPYSSQIMNPPLINHPFVPFYQIQCSHSNPKQKY